MKRLERATAIREQVLRSERTTWAEGFGARSKILSGLGWTASLHSPFNPLPSGRPQTGSYARAMEQARLSKKKILHWLLDVYVEGLGKVLSLEWDEHTANLISMKRGPWEQELFSLPPPSLR